MFATTKVKLDKDLVAKVKRYADLAGYSSAEEFITHALEKELVEARGGQGRGGDQEAPPRPRLHLLRDVPPS